ncbi:MAG: gamma carbonic anhydrase family protein [Rhodospirillales bacterium]|nr:gamma carbonic anhydrase family protein [Rhodospirillales bacterium]
MTAPYKNRGLVLPFEDKVPRLADGIFIAAGAEVIGDVEIGPGSSVWYNCVLRGDVNVIRVGSGSNIQDGTVIHVSRRTHGTFIGNDVTIGHMALIHGCTLEDRCFVGMRATVMDGCVVEPDAMLAAGALLTPGKRVPTGQLWAGSPAVFKREITADEAAYFAETAHHYAELAQRHMKSRG